MDPDQYQQAWRAQETQSRVTIDADLLRKEVQRNQRDFRAMIFRRDVIEILVGLVLIPFWFYKGATASLPWTWYLGVPAILYVMGFFVVDRIRHPQNPSCPDSSLLGSVKISLKQVEHQIWLLRNIAWWYLLPFTVAISAFFGHVTWLNSDSWMEAMLGGGGLFGFLFGLYGFIYWLNQHAVKSDLRPRRRELLVLYGNLDGEPAAREYETASDSHHKKTSQSCRRWHLLVAACVVAIVVCLVAMERTDSRYDGPAVNRGIEGESLAQVVSKLREENGLVGLAAMVMVDGEIESEAAQGQRKAGSSVSLQVDDLWHLGGITKSITATVVARLIESGQMNWDDTLSAVFPDATMHESWRLVTLHQLLTDTAGAPVNFPRGVNSNRLALGPECTEARRESVMDVISRPTKSSAGEKFAYSNVGYTIVGAMVEQVTGVRWEVLVEREVFEPLGLTSAGFGPPASSDAELQQPRGHRSRIAGKVAVDDKADNSAIMGPAGIVHMSLRDLCVFATEHMRGAEGEGKLLAQETYERLHLPALDRYACGWLKEDPKEFRPYTRFWHNGSNTFWYALVAFVPEQKLVVAVVSNDGDDQAESAAFEILHESTMAHVPSGFDLPEGEFAKASPFEAIRWPKDFTPEVQVDGEWYGLVSLDEIPTAEIVAFSCENYGYLWRKRFEEDLVEVLTRMGQAPSESVSLVVESLESLDTKVLTDVPMTRANRNAIKSAAKSE